LPAVVNTMRQFGAVFGIAIVTAVFDSHGSLASPAAVTSGYRPALLAAAAFSVLGAGASAALRRARRPAARDADDARTAALALTAD
jgi:hypothetical protein